MNRFSKMVAVVISTVVLMSCCGCTRGKNKSTTYVAGEHGQIEIKGESMDEAKCTEGGGYVYAIPDEGYEFVSWSDGRSEAVRGFSVVPNEKRITALFKIRECVVVYSASPGGYVEGELVQRLVYGEDATNVWALCPRGYEFLGWSDGVMTLERHDLAVKEDMEITAIFKQIMGTATYIAGEGGSFAYGFGKERKFIAYMYEA